MEEDTEGEKKGAWRGQEEKEKKKNDSHLHVVILTVNNSIFVRAVQCANTMCLCLQSKQKGMSKMLSREKHIFADMELKSWLSLKVEFRKVASHWIVLFEVSSF